MNLKLMKNKKFFGMALVACITASPLSALAAALPDGQPDAGKTLQGLKQTEMVLPQKKTDNLKVEEVVRPPLTADVGTKFAVTGVRFTGDVLFADGDLQKLVADGKGKESSLTDLEKLADRITSHYQSNGYLVARAYLPAQRIEGGMVEIAVLAGKYNKIILNNQTKIKDEAVQLQMGKVQSGAYIEKNALERTIWLISDLSGAEAKATLAPGTKTGTSDLILNILPKGVRISGNVGIDNYGNRFTGKNEITTNITILNPISKGDALSINGVTTGSGLNNGSITYALPAFSQGGRLDFSYSRMNYELGADYASLNATGTADTIGMNYIYNLRRSKKANLYTQIGFMNKKLRDNLGSVPTDKKTNVWTVGLNGDSLDSFGGGGANSYSATYSAGRLNAAGTTTSYGKGNFSAARQQYMNDRLSLLLFWNGQLASNNLDSSEKMSLGGAYGVRAYPKGEASGDEGMLLVSELRWTIPMAEKQGILQMVGFFDTGTVRVSKAPTTSGINHRTLNGTGLGMIWNDPGKTMLRMHYAWKVGSEDATSDTDKNGRLWAQMTKFF